MSMTIQLQGVDHIKSLLAADKLYRPAVRKMLAGIGKRGKAMGQSEAPVYSGKPKNGVQSGAYKKSVGYRASYKSVTIQVKAKNPRGFSYPNWLEFAPKSPHRGKFRKFGQRLVRESGGPIREAAHEIERTWGR